MKLNRQVVANRYGKAMFELSKEKNQVEEVYNEFLLIKQIFTQIPTLGDALTDIRLNATQKQSILAEINKDASEIVQNFLNLLMDNKRMNAVVFIIDNFIKRYNAEKGIVLGTVTTAVPLEKDQKEKIIRGVSQKLGVDGMELQEIVDNKIVAGVIVEADNKIIDGSLRTQMIKLRQLLNA